MEMKKALPVFIRYRICWDFTFVFNILKI